MSLRITLGDLLHDCANKYQDRPFLTIAETGDQYSYHEFESLTNRVAHGLQARFPALTDYLVIFLENNVEYLATSYALKKIDVIEVSVNRAMRGKPLARMIDQTGARVILTSSQHLQALAEVREQTPHLESLILTDHSDLAQELFPDLEIVKFADLLADRDDHLQSTASDTDTATILFTSGTTGVSKGCLLSHRYAVRIAENMIDPYRVTAEDCIYSPYPLSHVGAAYYDVLTTMLTGGRVILRAGFSVSNFWPEIQRYGATWFMMLGSVQQLLWAHPSQPAEREHQVSRCWGTPTPVSKSEFDARFNLHLIPGGGYGSTDAGWVIVPQWDHEGGIVLPHFEVEIHDPLGDSVPPGTPGELVVRPREAGVMSDGYFGMPDRTVQSWKNLWFHTGDIARLDEQGRFYFMHRMSERIRVKGEMVSAYEVEETVLAHPQIEDCAVIGVPATAGEEDIKLFVLLKEGESLAEAELRQFCKERLAKFMVPAHIVFLTDMPRTSTGKPEKGKLASL
ncbi:MAG: AMP-binding protein [Pseudomonadota bacterium]